MRVTFSGGEFALRLGGREMELFISCLRDVSAYNRSDEDLVITIGWHRDAFERFTDRLCQVDRSGPEIVVRVGAREVRLLISSLIDARQNHPAEQAFVDAIGWSRQDVIAIVTQLADAYEAAGPVSG